MTNAITAVTLPSDDASKKVFMQLINNITAQMQMIDDRREAINDDVLSIHEKFKIPKKVIRQLARAKFKDKIDETAHESTVMEALVEILQTEI